MTGACFGVWCGVVSRHVIVCGMLRREFWHVDVGVLLDGACCVGWCTRLLLLLRLCVVLTLFYNLDYG